MSGDEKKKHGTDAEEVKEILEVVSDKVPALLTGLADVLYGRDKGAKYGEAVAGFFKSLKEAGMTDEQAYELTKQYMAAMNLPSMIGQAIQGGKGKGEKGEGLNIKIGKDSDEDEE